MFIPLLPLSIAIDSEEFNHILYSMGVVRRMLYGVSAFVTNGLLGGLFWASFGIVGHAVFSIGGHNLPMLLLWIGVYGYGLSLGAICTFSGKVDGVSVLYLVIVGLVIAALVMPSAAKPIPAAKSVATISVWIAIPFLFIQMTIWSAILQILPTIKPYIMLQLFILKFFEGKWVSSSSDEPSKF